MKFYFPKARSARVAYTLCRVFTKIPDKNKTGQHKKELDGDDGGIIRHLS